jgi:hypothetical protein
MVDHEQESARVLQFGREAVRPALQTIKTALERQGRRVQVSADAFPATMTIFHEREREFECRIELPLTDTAALYRVNFSGLDPRTRSPGEDAAQIAVDGKRATIADVSEDDIVSDFIRRCR